MILINIFNKSIVFISQFDGEKPGHKFGKKS